MFYQFSPIVDLGHSIGGSNTDNIPHASSNVHCSAKNILITMRNRTDSFVYAAGGSVISVNTVEVLRSIDSSKTSLKRFQFFKTSK